MLIKINSRLAAGEKEKPSLVFSSRITVEHLGRMRQDKWSSEHLYIYTSLERCTSVVCCPQISIFTPSQEAFESSASNTEIGASVSCFSPRRRHPSSTSLMSRYK